MTTSEMADRLCPKQAADYIGLSVRTLARYRAERIGPTWLRVGRSVQYCRASIDAWLKAQEQTPHRNP